ncbi:MAG TPA: inorganic diphosphatase [Gammaproteobacteria bacterium]|nr:inorganic diphosphatase [Gammaproteobacteria bacterium]
MDFTKLGPGKNPPDDLNVIIEIPAQAAPVKYELDKGTGLLAVDRFLSTSMVYPANYGLIPATLCDDGDPLDVLVVTPLPLIHGALIRVRPVDLLEMSDEKGGDAKLVAVPVTGVYAGYGEAQSVDDLPGGLKHQITHFFENYKAFEPGKWVKLEGWGGLERARKEVLDCIERCRGPAAG